MSRIVSIGTAVPAFCHQQNDILQFMEAVYAVGEAEMRKLRFVYRQSGIQQRYSVLSDYSRPVNEWRFYPQSENLEPFPSLEQRMAVFSKHAPQLSIDAIRNCLDGVIHHEEITHLMTVSCTGLSAPGLDLQVMELLDLRKDIFRTSVNFMGCYAAIHALKLANIICKGNSAARVLIVCTELCTLHFQREATPDNIMSSLLFADGAAAALIVPEESDYRGLDITGFYSEVIPKGKRDMAWELSSTGFLMTLSGYVPELIEEDFSGVVERSLRSEIFSQDEITHWCIHPGGKKILEAIQKSTGVEPIQLQESYHILKNYGNMSSATILFVLKNILHQNQEKKKVFAASFGPGLTVETFTAVS
ncbi:type III polyketide synthase [Chitinophagaceae bacterium LB-8]|uniref:Type III polyketide synthase n=1 Tax=Paraflavisolibacter caeni TaxID=2982496 RepID=A0A9X2XTG6_9BACT|nr:type III polyketide synthase [Paraflavisolibacter caeni]MCU7548042.1 type III polyketide synthase [Paraflavisolibacter caeni]